jgi:hypothetical protein
MATVTKNGIRQSNQFGGTPYGNLSVLPFTLQTNASGVMTDSNQTTALVQADKVRLGTLPAGMVLMDCLSIVSDAFTASETAKIGFEYADGVDDATVAQDDDYFHAALALSAAGRTRANNTAVTPVRLAKDAYLIVTIAGADTAAVGRLDVLVQGVIDGPQ